MALTKTFPGQITDFVASEVIPSLSTVTAPLTAITTDFQSRGRQRSRRHHYDGNRGEQWTRHANARQIHKHLHA